MRVCASSGHSWLRRRDRESLGRADDERSNRLGSVLQSQRRNGHSCLGPLRRGPRRGSTATHGGRADVNAATGRQRATAAWHAPRAICAVCRSKPLVNVALLDSQSKRCFPESVQRLILWAVSGRSVSRPRQQHGRRADICDAYLVDDLITPGACQRRDLDEIHSETGVTIAVRSRESSSNHFPWCSCYNPADQFAGFRSRCRPFYREVQQISDLCLSDTT